MVLMPKKPHPLPDEEAKAKKITVALDLRLLATIEAFKVAHKQKTRLGTTTRDVIELSLYSFFEAEKFPLADADE